MTWPDDIAATLPSAIYIFIRRQLDDDSMIPLIATASLVVPALR